MTLLKVKSKIKRIEKWRTTKPYLLNPQHPLSVIVIGCGGTGSQVISNLARVNIGLLGLGHPGLVVTAYDGDKVDNLNIGRQLFLESEIGMYKSYALINRMNAYFGLNWKCIEEDFKKTTNVDTGNIYFVCVDSGKARLEVYKYLKYMSKKKKKKMRFVNNSHFYDFMYVIDIGNGKDFGQIMLSDFSKDLPAITDVHPDIDRFDDDEPSCSLAQSLNKQNLFINSIMGTLATNLLWIMITTGKVDRKNIYVDLKNYQIN